MQSLLILGRQPSLGMAELERLYGARALRPVGENAVIVDVDPCLLAFPRLGGSIKFAKVLTTLETANWNEIEKFLCSVSPEHSKAIPEGKMYLGLSSYGFAVTPPKMQATALNIKRAIKKTGRNVRVIPNNEPALSSAQVFHNRLTGEHSWELLIIADGPRSVIAQTVMVQDITAYARRDRERPKRDAKVGMLPPKLAQIIINLAAGRLADEELHSICDVPADKPRSVTPLHKTILDPFCGSGVILQEAVLMGYTPYGSDIDTRMVAYAAANLAWLAEQYHMVIDAEIDTGDATTAQWKTPIFCIASEVYLGRPFTEKPNPELLAKTVAECNLIIKKFLRQAYSQTKSGSSLCIAVPAWQTSPHVFRHLPLIDQMSDLGYNRVSLEHVSHDQMIYYRPEQFVARELLVLTRK
jgi:tRNA G10  N-methylase Trm11